jgi:O-antigen/teichoic acid export membrane protein
MAIYCGIAAIFPETLLNFFYGHQYAGYGNIVMLFVLSHFIAFFNRIPTMGLKALKKPHKIFHGNLIAAVIAVLLAIPLMKYYGIYGACIGMILTQTIWLIVFSYFYQHALKNRQHALSETMHH